MTSYQQVVVLAGVTDHMTLTFNLLTSKQNNLLHMPSWARFFCGNALYCCHLRWSWPFSRP